MLYLVFWVFSYIISNLLTEKLASSILWRYFSLVPGHHNKASITIRQMVIFFVFVDRALAFKLFKKKSVKCNKMVDGYNVGLYIYIQCVSIPSPEDIFPAFREEGRERNINVRKKC